MEQRIIIGLIVLVLASLVMLAPALGAQEAKENKTVGNSMATKNASQVNKSAGNSNSNAKKNKEQKTYQLKYCLEQGTNKSECLQMRKEQVKKTIVARMNAHCEKFLGNKSQKCVDKVAALETCWSKQPGLERATCAREELGIGRQGQLRTKLKDCNQSGNMTQCKEQIKSNVYNYVSLRLNGLSDRAEALLDQGASEETVADFVDSLSGVEEQFSNASTLQEKKQFLTQARQMWKDFIAQVRSEIQNG